VKVDLDTHDLSVHRLIQEEFRNFLNEDQKTTFLSQRFKTALQGLSSPGFGNIDATTLAGL
jgi:hypothetical protein